MQSGWLHPDLLPDEHVYSALVRHHATSGNRSQRVTAHMLGLPAGPIRPRDVCGGAFPRAVEALARMTGRSFSHVAQNHTLVPFFFCSVSRSSTETTHNHGAATHRELARGERIFHTAELPIDRSWAFCEECRVADRERWGIPYWHVSHQIPGLTRCPHHWTRLTGTCPACGEGMPDLKVWSLPNRRCDCELRDQPSASESWERWLYRYFESATQAQGGSREATIQILTDAMALPNPLFAKDWPLLGERLDALLASSPLREFSVLFNATAAGPSYGKGLRGDPISGFLEEGRRKRARHPLFYLLLAYANDLEPHALLKKH